MLLTASAVFITAFQFQPTLLATVSSMQVRTTESALKAVGIALGLTFFIYTFLSILAIYMYGSALQSDLIKSLDSGGYNWASIVISIAFFVVLVCHIPFIFFAGKEAFLIMIDEFDRKAISNVLNELIERVQ